MYIKDNIDKLVVCENKLQQILNGYTHLNNHLLEVKDEIAEIWQNIDQIIYEEEHEC